MGSPTRPVPMLCVLGASLAAYLSVATCEAADRADRFVDSGRPRELINQPMSCLPEHSDDLQYCEVANKI